jgi:polysaccharide export outer membrane protein
MNQRITLGRCWLPLALVLIPVALGSPLSGQAQETATGSITSYAIGVGDTLSISVWKNEELSVTVPVLPDGRISVPLIGDLVVAGRTPMQVREELLRAFEEYVTAPAVSVVVDEIRSRRVFVLGEVANSGVYDIFQPTKLLQALAMAGGLTEYAKKDQVIVLRDRGGEDQRLDVSIKGIQTGRRPADNILLEPGDTIIVP